jgi:hypothetical protein
VALYSIPSASRQRYGTQDLIFEPVLEIAENSIKFVRAYVRASLICDLPRISQSIAMYLCTKWKVGRKIDAVHPPALMNIVDYHDDFGEQHRRAV